MYLVNTADPVSLVLDLHIAHDEEIQHQRHRVLSIDKIRKYHGDYNDNPPSAVSFMSVIPSTSGRLHSEFIKLLLLQDPRETGHFFTDSGVHSVNVFYCHSKLVWTNLIGHTT